MLFLLPLGWVPLAVAAGNWVSLNADVVRGRRHRERVVVLLCSCWYVSCSAPAPSRGAAAAYLGRGSARWRSVADLYLAEQAAPSGAVLGSTPSIHSIASTASFVSS